MNDDFYIELSLKDFEDNVLRCETYPFKSFLINWVKYEHSQRINATIENVQDVSGSLYTQQIPVSNIAAPVAEGISQYGIVVGAGSSVFTGSEYSLETLINHGSSTDHLNYGSCSITAPTVSGNTTSMEIERHFTNNSGADVTVREVGVYTWTTDTGAQARYIAMSRDLIPTWNVPDSSSFIVRIFIK